MESVSLHISLCVCWTSSFLNKAGKPRARWRHHTIHLMSDWTQLVWDSPPETDAHRDSPRDPYQNRDRLVTTVDRPRPRITDFVSQYAIGDNLSVSAELLLRSRQLLTESKQQIMRVRMRLLMSHSGQSIQ